MIPRFQLGLSWPTVISLLRQNPVSTDSVEEAFSTEFGFPHAIWFPYGRIAVRCFLENLDTTKREVVLSPFNCLALGNAIASAGFTPRYVDTEHDSFNPITASYASLLDSSSVSTGIAVSLWGIPTSAHAFAHSKKPILHDLAMSTLDRNRPILRNQDAAMYSLGWGKPLSSFRGAFLCGVDKNAADKWRQWRDRKMVGKKCLKTFTEAAIVKLSLSRPFFRLSEILHSNSNLGRALTGHAYDRNSLLQKDSFGKLTTALAALNFSALDGREILIRKRQQQISLYLSELSHYANSEFILPPPLSFLSHFAIRMNSRTHFAGVLRKSGIFTSTSLFGKLLSDYAWLRDPYHPGDFPNARRLTHTTIHLPLHHSMSVQDQMTIIEAVKKALTKSERSSVSLEATQ